MTKRNRPLGEGQRHVNAAGIAPRRSHRAPPPCGPRRPGSSGRPASAVPRSRGWCSPSLLSGAALADPRREAGRGRAQGRAAGPEPRAAAPSAASMARTHPLRGGPGRLRGSDGEGGCGRRGRRRRCFWVSPKPLSSLRDRDRPPSEGPGLERPQRPDLSRRAGCRGRRRVPCSGRDARRQAGWHGRRGAYGGADAGAP